jgi:NAD-dependent DNA ligase
MSKDIRVAAATDARLLKRSCESLLGIAAGLVADGELNEKEVLFLSTWLAEHPEIAGSWPGEVIVKRVRETLADGMVSAEELVYLRETLEQAIGGSFSQDGAVATGASTLPIDAQASVVILGASFCFTGKFLFGTRAACEKAVTGRGGVIESVQQSLRYLVIGELSSRDWKYSSHGTKIEAAMRIKSMGQSLSVVSEAQWISAL